MPHLIEAPVVEEMRAGKTGLMYNLLLEFRHFIIIKKNLYQLPETVWIMRQFWAIPILAVGALVFGTILGLLATRLSLEMALMALGGLVVFLTTLYRPELVILLILTISSTIVDYDNVPRIKRLTPIELCLMLLLGLLLIRTLSNKGAFNKGEFNFVRTPLDWPVFLFLVATTISFFNAKYNLGTYDSIKSFPTWRILFSYMVFFAVTNFIRSRQQLMTLVGGMFVMATVVATFMIVQQIVGPSVSIIPGQERVGTATALGEGFDDVARVRVSGAAMVYVMLLPAFILHITPEYPVRKWLSFIPVVLLTLALLFMFTRSVWIGAILSTAIFVIIARSKGRKFILLMAGVIIAISLLIPLINAYFPKVDSIVEAVSLRAGSLFAGDKLIDDSSTQWRLRENEFAIAKIKEYPLLGIGLGGAYRTPWWVGDPLTHYIHNAYFYLLLDVGIIGFLPFLLFSILYLFRGFSSWFRIQDPVLKGLVLGFTLSYIAVLSSSMSSPRLLESAYTPLIGVMLGVNEVAIKLERQSSR